MNRLNIATQLWAKEKGLDTADPAMQILKIYEELAEMTQAYTRQQPEELLMELGDVYVTLAIFALQVGIEPTEALKTAYKKIAGREGKLVNGTFIKEEDLKELEEMNELEKVVAEKDRLDELRSSRLITNEPTTNIQRHKELTDFMHQTYIDKNKDYGDSFGQTHKKYGALAGLTRIADKFHRLENIILNDTTIQVDDESVIDTLVDMSNYGLLLAMELEKENEHED